MAYFVPFIVLDPQTLILWTITIIRIWRKSRMISPIDSPPPPDKVD